MKEKTSVLENEIQSLNIRLEEKSKAGKDEEEGVLLNSILVIVYSFPWLNLVVASLFEGPPLMSKIVWH